MEILRCNLKLILVLIFPFLIGGCSFFPQEEQPLSVPLVKPVQETYKTINVEKKTMMNRFKGTAVFESSKTEDYMYAFKGARLGKVYVKSGEFVKKGDLLADLLIENVDMQQKTQLLAVTKANYNYKLAKKQIPLDPDLLNIAKLELDIEQTKYDEIKHLVESSKITSRLDGVVTFVTDAETGTFIEPYTTLATVADPTSLRLSCRSADTQKLKQVELGMNADVLLDGGIVHGKVAQIPTTAPKTIDSKLADKYASTLYVNLNQIPDGVSIGQFVQINILLQKKNDALVLPRGAVRRYMGSKFVKVLENKTLREYEVETGIESDTEIEITSGLKEGQQIVSQN